MSATDTVAPVVRWQRTSEDRPQRESTSWPMPAGRLFVAAWQRIGMSESEGRTTSVSRRMTESAYERIEAHRRDGETLSGCIERAFDALERHEELPAAIRNELGSNSDGVRNDE